MNKKMILKLSSLVFCTLIFLTSSCGQKQKQEEPWEDARLKFVRDIGRMNLSQIPGIVLTDEEKDDWLRMHEFIPTAEEMNDRTFFQMLQMEEMSMVKDAVVKNDFETARLELKKYYQQNNVQNQLLDLYFERKIDSAQVVKNAQKSFKEKNFKKKDRYYQAFTIWGMMYDLLRAYRLNGELEYLDGWFRIFNFFYHELRPPAGTPDVYVSVNGTTNPWNTLQAASRLEHLIIMKLVIDENSDIAVDPEYYLNLCKSIFELQDFLVRMNYRFYNSNWQIHQMTMLLKSTVAFPEIKNSFRIAQMAWKSILFHMEKETLDDGGHNELATGYASGVINLYKHALIYARLAGLEVPDSFLAGLHSMYNWLADIADPGLGLPPAGDGGISLPGSLVGHMIDGALLFHDPECKWFIEKNKDRIQTHARSIFGSNYEKELTAFALVRSKKPNRTSLILKESGYGIMRSSRETDSNYLMIDFGSNEPWHAQADFLSINVYAFGHPVITNSGVVRYDTYRTRKWYKQTVSHNTVWVNGMSQEKSHDGELENWVTTPHFDFISASHPGYLFLGVKHRRKILYIKGDLAAGIPEYWLVSDDLLKSDFTQTTGYFDARWLAHFQPTKLKVASDHRVSTTNEDANVVVIPMDTTGQRLSIDKGWMRTLPSNGSTEVDDAPFIQLVQEGEPPLLWSILIYPFKGKMHPEIVVDPLLIDFSPEDQYVFQEKAGIRRAFRINVKGEEHIWFEYPEREDVHQFGIFRSDGTTGLLIFKEENIKRFFLLNASRLDKNDEEIFSSDSNLNWIDLSISEECLEIFADKKCCMKILTTGVKSVRFNRQLVPFVQSGDYVIVR